MTREKIAFIVATGIVLVALSATIAAQAIDEARRIEAVGRWAR
jgi:hypothetical protein